MRFDVEYGFQGPDKSISYYEVSATARFVPDPNDVDPPPPFAHSRDGGSRVRFPDNAAGFQTLYVPAGMSGIVEATVRTHVYFGKPSDGINPFNAIPFPLPLPFDIPNPAKGEGIPDLIDGDVLCSVRWNLTSASTGGISLTNQRTSIGQYNGFGEQIQDITVRTVADKGIAQFTPYFEYTGEGKKFSSHPMNFVLAVELKNVKPPPPTPRPVPKPTPAPSPVPAFIPLKHTVYFLVDKSDHLSSENSKVSKFPNKQDQKRALRTFIDGIKTKYKPGSIQSIQCHGYASSPGSTEHNDILARARADNIANWLLKQENLKVKDDDIISHGEPSTTVGREREDPEWRRVDVFVFVKI